MVSTHLPQLERQISQKQRQIQRLTRKLERESNMGRVAASNGEEEGPVEDRCNKVHYSTLLAH